MMVRLFLSLLMLCFMLSATAQRRIYDDDISELVSRMEGSFDSQEQARQDSANYYNISLHMKRIWADKKASKKGYWLYVEQALAKMPDKPYRQRVYHIIRKDNETVESKVYELPNPERYVGAWQDEKLLKGLSRDSLIDRPGCSIFLKMDEDGNFRGSTPGKECLSSLRGATYATSEAVIYPNMLVSWDRGWDAADKQVWGAEKGGYRFSKWGVLKTSKDKD